MRLARLDIRLAQDLLKTCRQVFTHMIKLGLLSKLLKPPLSGDILPHELNRSLGAHVDLSQLAVYLNGEDEISLSVKMKKCTFKCSKITGKENVKTGAVTYEENNLTLEIIKGCQTIYSMVLKPVSYY